MQGKKLKAKLTSIKLEYYIKSSINIKHSSAK
jgi:hypothetical protein